MFEAIRNFFRRKALRKIEARTKTSLIPVGGIRTAMVVLNVEDQGFNECKDEMLAFFRSKGIKAEIFFFDFRKLEKNELLLTSIQNTILRKDLNWFGMPSRDRMGALLSRPCDLFISMTDRDDFANTYTSMSVDASFKIGRRETSGKVYDMVVSGGNDLCEIFRTMQEYLLKIQ